MDHSLFDGPSSDVDAIACRQSNSHSLQIMGVGLVREPAFNISTIVFSTVCSTFA